MLDDPPEHDVGAEGDVEVGELADDDRRRQIGHREADVRGADVGGEDHARRRVERELRRWAAASGRRLAGRSDQRAGQSASTRWANVERPRPVAAASSLRVRGSAVAQVLQERPGTVHPSK